MNQPYTTDTEDTSKLRPSPLRLWETFNHSPNRWLGVKLSMDPFDIQNITRKYSIYHLKRYYFFEGEN